MLGEWRAGAGARWAERRGLRSARPVELPRFSTPRSLELATQLIASASAPRSSPGGDLDGCSTAPAGKGAGRVLQRARVDVDEAGTRAAATTAVTMRATGLRCR